MGLEPYFDQNNRLVYNFLLAQKEVRRENVNIGLFIAIKTWAMNGYFTMPPVLISPLDSTLFFNNTYFVML